MSVEASATKQCSRCRAIKPMEAFSRSTREKSGLQSGCKACAVTYYAANKDAIKARHTERYAANKDAILARCATYRAANKDAIKTYRAEYYETHRDKILAKFARELRNVRADAETLADLFESLPMPTYGQTTPDLREDLAWHIYDSEHGARLCRASSRLNARIAEYVDPDVREEMKARLVEAMLSA